MRTLVIADETPARAALRRELVLAGWDVILAEDEAAGLRRVQAESPDAIVLDGGRANGNALQLVRILRRSGNHTPLLMLTNGDESADGLGCLNAGADDFMRGPYDVRELSARLRSLARRSGNGSWGLPLRFEGLELDGEERVARIGERTVQLTRTEFQLLELFMLNPRRVLKPEMIYDRVWGYDFGPHGNALRVYIGYLRRKLEAGGERRLLHTLRGVGYVLREPGPEGTRGGVAG
ncbi:MAG TPA: response regulator transcription factor [Thermoleophilaceae bacterium]